jgi:cytochrome c-type protein NapC
MRPKLLLFITLVIGGVFGLIASYGTHFALEKTSGQEFCVVCHEMDPMVITYRSDAHGGAGPVGASARCVDCHLPHDGLLTYIFSKAKNGVVEGAIHFFGNPDAIDWQAKMKERQEFVFDNGCLKCHENVLDFSLSKESAQAKKMHKHYKALKGTEKEIKCASCHFDAGHKGLRNVLNYYKPEHDLYKDKMQERKVEVQKEYKRFGIKAE